MPAMKSTTKTAKPTEVTKAALGMPGKGDPRVDRFAELLAWSDEIKKDPRTKELEELKKTLIAEANKTNKPEDEVKLTGLKMSVQLSACTEKTTVLNLREVHKLMGDETFYQVASVSIKGINDYLTLPQRDKVTTTDHTDTRLVKGKPAKIA